MRPEARKLLVDMLEAAHSIPTFVSGISESTFAADDRIRSSVYFKFIIIGEALSQLRNIDASIVAQVSEATRIIGFRNQIVHGYGRLDHEITWRVIEQKVPILIDQLEALLREA